MTKRMTGLKKEWYKIKGVIQFFKNDKIIREYKFNSAHDRRRILKIWNSEVKPNKVDEYYLIIKMDDI
jgi:hypothetical protein